MSERVADVDLAALGEERDFLLRSLRDLEAEHDAQDIDDVDYETLRDDYTARTAEVLRALERAKRPVPVGRPGRKRALGPPGAGLVAGDDGTGVGDDPAATAVASPARRSTTRWRLVAIVASVLLFGVIAGWLVTSTSGSRATGQSITGNSNLRSPAPAPSLSEVDSQLAKAAQLMNSGKNSDALDLYEQILRTSPNQPEAQTYFGWLLATYGLQQTPVRTDLVDAGLKSLVAAEKGAPSYADPHFFRGFLLLNAKNDPSDAVTELRTYLGTVDPSSPQVPQVEAVLKQAIAAAGPNVPPGPNAPKASEAPTSAP